VNDKENDSYKTARQYIENAGETSEREEDVGGEEEDITSDDDQGTLWLVGQ
jgi:hypothetical protein